MEVVPPVAVVAHPPPPQRQFSNEQFTKWIRRPLARLQGWPVGLSRVFEIGLKAEWVMGWNAVPEAGRASEPRTVALRLQSEKGFLKANRFAHA